MLVGVAVGVVVAVLVGVGVLVGLGVSSSEPPQAASTAVHSTERPTFRNFSFFINVTYISVLNILSAY